MDGRLVRVRDLTAKPVPESSSRPGSMGDFGGSVGPVISVLSLPCSGRRPPPIGAAEAACHSDGNPILFKKDCPGKPRVRGAVAACPRLYGQSTRQRQVPRPGILQQAAHSPINRRPKRPGARPRSENRPSPSLRNRQTKTPGRDCRAFVQGRITLREAKSSGGNRLGHLFDGDRHAAGDRRRGFLGQFHGHVGNLAAFVKGLGVIGLQQAAL